MFEEELSALSTADLLESAAEERATEQRSAARSLVHAVVYADRFHPDATPDRPDRPGRRASDGRERAVVLGGDGCPPVLEFCVSEYGAVVGVSPGVARDYLATSLALRHRFPFVWARVLGEEIAAWKARNLARDCMKLSLAAALYVDSRVAHLLDTISPTRLAKIIKAAKMHADPDLARAEAGEKTDERGVWVGRSDEHGTKTCVIKASSGAVRRHKAKIDEIADALLAHGDKRSVQIRRAEAVGILPDTAFTNELLAQAQAHHHTTPAPDSTPDTAPTPASAPAAAPHDVATGNDPWADGTPSGSVDHRAHHTPTAHDEAEVHDRIVDDEPGPDDEADREAPHPGESDLPDPLDPSDAWTVDPFEPASQGAPETGESMTPDELRALAARLAQIKHDAHARPHGQRPTPARPGKTEVYVHLTDRTLATGTGLLRVEDLGPLLAEQFTDAVGYGPYVVKPVIDLNKAISTDAYEITDRIREHVKLTHPAELFPYGTRETINSIDLDHIQPYDSLGPPGQTNTLNLIPLSRFGHRVKTHAAGWKVRRIDAKTIEWTTPHGFVFRVDRTGTHRVLKEAPNG